jgi:hypothetical protein
MKREAIDKLRLWRSDYVQAVRDIFKVEPDEWQKEGLMYACSPATYKRVAFKACTGPGKTAELAWVGWLRLLLYASPEGHPKGAALSGEGRDNLRDNLWAELAKWRNRSELLQQYFTWTKEMIFCNEHPETWFLSARSYPKDADAEAIGKSLSGLHSPYPFMLLDEIGSMPASVGQKAEQIFTGGVKDGLIMAAGNPTDINGLLYKIFSELQELWSLITITADPDDPKRTPRVPVEHARKMIETYGRDNPWVMSTILGKFPPGGLNNLISAEDVQKAIERGVKAGDYEYSQKRLGVDVARFGDDRTVLFPRQGLRAFAPTELRNARTNDIAAKVMQLKQSMGIEMEFVDGSGGWGAGVVDSLIQAGASPYEVSFSGKAIDPRYLNKRAEMWFNMAEWIKRGGSLPNVPGLVKELSAPTYTFQNGKFKLEEKDQIKDRLGFSPDYADALALTFAMPDMPASMVDGVNMYPNRGKLLHDYDPFQEK